MEIEIDYYELPPIEYNGKTLYGFTSLDVEYDVEIDSWDYPLASVGSRSEKSIVVESFEPCFSVTDESGEEIFDDTNIPNDLRNMYIEILDEVVEDLVHGKVF